MAVTNSIQHTGRVGGGTYRGTVVADTEEEARQWARGYYSVYPTQGYFTSVSAPKQRKDGKWVMRVYRAGSCS